MSFHVLDFIDRDGNELGALTPAFVLFRRVRGNVDITPKPTIAPLQNGFYYFEYEPLEPHYFIADGGAAITDLRVRYSRGVVNPGTSELAQFTEELLKLMRNDRDAGVTENGKTYDVIYESDGVTPFRKWEIQDQLDRPVVYPSTSRLPVKRIRVL